MPYVNNSQRSAEGAAIFRRTACGHCHEAFPEPFVAAHALGAALILVPFIVTFTVIVGLAPGAVNGANSIDALARAHLNARPRPT